MEKKNHTIESRKILLIQVNTPMFFLQFRAELDKIKLELGYKEKTSLLRTPEILKNITTSI